MFHVKHCLFTSIRYHGAMLNDAIDFSSVQRVLVIKLRHHGDVLLTSPVFTVLKQHAPHIEVDALVYAGTAEMLTEHPHISHVHVIDRKWKHLGALRQASAELRLLGELRARHYDLVVHLTEHPRGAWLTRLLGARYAVARSRSGRLWRKAFTHFYPIHGRGNARHTVESNLDALRRIGIQPKEQDRQLILEPGRLAREKVQALLARHGLTKGGFIHLHPASRWQFKCWENAKVADLIRQLHSEGHKLVLTGAPSTDEQAMLADILRLANVPLIDLSGQLSLKELAALTEQASCFVGVDSAPMHIAAAMRTPVVVLFGPSGDIEWGPWMVEHRLLVSDHSCRPCGQDGCGGGKVSECLITIPVERVRAAIHEILG